MIYLNGVLDGSTTTGSSYQGTTGSMYIGKSASGGSVNPLSGYIDQVTISNRAKTACEILNDVTLVSYFSFDNVTTDSGPNTLSSYITLQSNSGVSFVTGRVGQALILSRTNAFFQTCGYYWLGHNNRAFSFALWIYLISVGGTILHLSSDRSGSGSWCLPKLGFSSNGSIAAQSWSGSCVVSVVGPQIPTNNWTHIVQTWSSTSGLRLYINGGLYGSFTMTTYVASNQNMCIFLGTSGFETNCQTLNIIMGSYSGRIDEFYVYDRELTENEICPLAHPYN
ncbi:unnamed protein product [Rotaria sordida]|uniref:LamG domain-containing protein n=1 Tax=Rotaria sordida TaxID=392033 RepID=A0A816EE45_9BILA|nr:unnamed protein product [Rotaria sordida]CAF1646621.1 unnamed protein product [Rotaria sordida]